MIILIGVLILSGCAKTKYVCPDDSTVSDISQCPKNPKLVISTECSTTMKDPFGGESFPDVVMGMGLKIQAECDGCEIEET